MERNLKLFSTLILLACVFGSAFSQCPTFYADYNEQGGSFQMCSSGNVPPNWNDQVSSLVVPAGYSVLLYQNYGYGGQTVGPYTQGTYNVPDWFNDQLSSVSVTQQSDNDNNNCVTLYADYNEQGGSFQMCSSGDVPSQWNDQVSSFVVPPGLSVLLYQNYGYGGQTVGPYTQGTYNVPGWFNDQLSSIAISQESDDSSDGNNNENSDSNDDSDESDCVTFYVDYNEQGGSFQMCRSGDVPANYNDQVSSLYVPRGVSVMLYQNYGQGGQSVGPYGHGTYNVPGWFNDQLSSVAINRRGWR